MKRLVAVILGTWMLTAASGAGAFILSTEGSDSYTRDNLTLKHVITFDYMFSAVNFNGGSWLVLNSSVINSVLGSPEEGKFKDWTPSVTGWRQASIDTYSGYGEVHDLVFKVHNEGDPNSAVVEIRNVAVHSAPEPTTLALMGIGLAGMGFARRMKKT